MLLNRRPPPGYCRLPNGLLVPGVLGVNPLGRFGVCGSGNCCETVPECTFNADGASYSDTFTSFSADYRTYLGGGGATESFSVSGGQLLSTGTHAGNDIVNVCYRSFGRPVLDGLQISLACDVWFNGTPAAICGAGIGIGSTEAYEGLTLANINIRYYNGPTYFGWYLRCGAQGETAAMYSVGSPSFPIRMELLIEDVSSGGGDYDVTCTADDDTIHVFSDAALTPTECGHYGVSAFSTYPGMVFDSAFDNLAYTSSW